MPPLDLYDVGFVGVAGASAGGASRSTADTDAVFCGGTASPWTPLSVSQYWNGDSWDNTMTAIPVATVFGEAGGNHDGLLFAGGDTGTGTTTPTGDTFEWNGSAWASATPYPQTFLMHDGGFAFGGNLDSAFINSGTNGYVAPLYYILYSGKWNGDSWAESVSSAFGGQGRCGDGDQDDFIATAGYGYNGGASLVQTWTVESFNGTSWSTGGTAEEDFPTDGADGKSAYAYGGGAASGRESFLANCSSTSLTNCAFKYDGDSWEAAGTLAETVVYCGGGGDSGNAMLAAGNDNSWDLVSSQTYNGETFVSKADLGTGLSAGGMGGNS